MAPLRIAVPDLVSNSYFPAVAAVDLGCFGAEGLDADLPLVFPVDRAYRVVKGRRIGAAPWVDLGLRRLLVEAGIDIERDQVAIAPVPEPPRPAASDGLRSGAAYLDSLRHDGRTVYVEGERVADVTAHVAFRRAAESIASLYDAAADPARRAVMTFPAPGTGRPALRAYQIPRTRDELAEKRAFHQTWAEMTFGLMGRTPDHVASFLSGFAARPAVFASAGQSYADNVVRFHEQARDEHLYVAYAIVPPQIDRSKPAHRQSDPTLYAGVVGERDDGIVLRGAQQLATGAVLADYVYISCIHPLQPGDENYAFAVAVPAGAAGLKRYARRPFARSGVSAFDYPLSSRFDESDALGVLDGVFVPWERVFVYRNATPAAAAAEGDRSHGKRPARDGSGSHRGIDPAVPAALRPVRLRVRLSPSDHRDAGTHAPPMAAMAGPHLVSVRSTP